MELFHDNGHLTDAGLSALLAGTLDELQRLEAAEHLAFCDPCLDRYTALLAEPVLDAPPADLTLPVLRRIRRRAARLFAGRGATAAAAAVFALGLWSTGVFGALVPTAPQQQRPAPPKQGGFSISNALSGAFGTMQGGLDNILTQGSDKLLSPLRGTQNTDLAASPTAE